MKEKVHSLAYYTSCCHVLILIEMHVHYIVHLQVIVLKHLQQHIIKSHFFFKFHKLEKLTSVVI